MAPNVCLLEEDGVTRDHLVCALSSEGMSVVQHNPTQDAPLPPEVAPVDVFLISVVMKEIDGFELLRHLNRSGDRRPVIVYSREARDYVQFAEKLGATKGLTVFRIQDLGHVVEAVWKAFVRGGRRTVLT